MTSCLIFFYSVPMHVMRQYNAKPQRICIFFFLEFWRKCLHTFETISPDSWFTAHFRWTVTVIPLFMWLPTFSSLGSPLGSSGVRSISTKSFVFWWIFNHNKNIMFDLNQKLTVVHKSVVFVCKTWTHYR